MPFVIELPDAAAVLAENYMANGFLLPGMTIAIPGSVLPPYCLWADRSFVSFEDWPELNISYLSGLLDTLPYDSVVQDQIDFPGKWIEVEDGSGLFLPDLGGNFLRPWRPDQSVDAGRLAGSLQGDAIRNLTGYCQHYAMYVNNTATSGVFYKTGPGNYSWTGNAENTRAYARWYFDASRQVPTADEVRPINYAQPMAIFMGKANVVAPE